MAFSPRYPENNGQEPDNYTEYTLRQRFHRIFSHGWDFIIKETPESAWKSVKKYKLTEQKAWYKYTDSEEILGLRFGQETTHGMYDIDLGSIHDPRKQEESLRLLEGELEEWGIVRFVLLQSSYRQGLHLYFFLAKPVNTFRLACVMNKAASEVGIEIKRGQLETFPNTKGYNRLFNGHRLPLQQGSYLLDKDYIPYSNRLEDFLDAAEWSEAGNDVDLLESRLDEAYEWFKALKNKQRIYQPTPEDKDFLEQIEYAQREIKEGFLNQIRIRVEKGLDDFHQTNDLLLTIGKLARLLHGLSEKKLIKYIRETIVSCPGYAQYCRHKHEIERRCKDVARYAEKQWFPYRSSLPQDRPTYKYIKSALTDKTNLNKESKQKARARIKMAVEQIERERKEGLPKKVGECKLLIRNVTKEQFGISVSDATLKKAENLPLWHPKYRVKPNPAEPQEQIEEEPVVKEIEVEEQETTTVISIEEKPEAPKPTQDFSSNKCQLTVDVREKGKGKKGKVSRSSFFPEPSTLNQSQPINKDGYPSKSCHPTNNTIEPKTEPTRLNISNILQRENQPTVGQKILQPKQPDHKQYKNQSTPSNVICQKEASPKTLKSIPSLDLQKTVHTLPYMKGMMFYLVMEFFFQLFQRAYYNALMRIPRLELIYQSNQDNSSNGLVECKGKKGSLLKSISSNTEVEILRKDYHSSSFRDNPPQLLVYVKPIENALDWLNGIPVLIDSLFPIRIKDKISKDKKTREINKNQDKSLEINDKSNLYPKIPEGGENLP